VERAPPPGGERFGKTRPFNAPDKQVTNGVAEESRETESRISTLIIAEHAAMSTGFSTTLHQREALPDLTRQGEGHRKGTYS